MADDWEDWEDDNFVPPNLTSQLADSSLDDKFADEDADLEEDRAFAVEKPKPKKKVTKTYDDKGKVILDEPLDDPVAEKIRQQRLVEEADYQATLELFGGDKGLDNFIPKTQKDFEEYSRMVVHKYILPYADSSHYKTLLKSLNKTALVPVGAQETKDVETSIAGLRADKLKQEREAVKEKKDAGKKKGLNLGRGGAGKGFDAMGDVDDYLDDGALDDDDDYDFM